MEPNNLLMLVYDPLSSCRTVSRTITLFECTAWSLVWESTHQEESSGIRNPGETESGLLQIQHGINAMQKISILTYSLTALRCSGCNTTSSPYTTEFCTRMASRPQPPAQQSSRHQDLTFSPQIVSSHRAPGHSRHASLSSGHHQLSRTPS